jgi:hypothetical protein
LAYEEKPVKATAAALDQILTSSNIPTGNGNIPTPAVLAKMSTFGNEEQLLNTSFVNLVLVVAIYLHTG